MEKNPCCNAHLAVAVAARALGGLGAGLGAAAVAGRAFLECRDADFCFSTARGFLKSDRLASMAKHNYSKTTGVEPNLTFTPDGKWIIFSGNFHSPQVDGKHVTHVYAVELAKSK